MLITEAYAQSAAGAGGAGDIFLQFLPLIAIFAILYFLMIRPQQKRMKEHQNMVSNIRRGDVVTTTGGIIGKITKVVDDVEVMVEIAKDVKVRVVRQQISSVQAKSEPVKDSASKK